MKIEFINLYRKRETGKVVYRYKITGTEAELKEYLATIEPKFQFKDPDGSHIMLSTNDYGNTATLNKSKNGKFYPDNTKAIRLATLEKQHGSIEVAKIVMQGDAPQETAE